MKRSRHADEVLEEQLASSSSTNSAHASSLAVPCPFACSRVVAPMVGASDLAFRLLCRRHGADAAYTEMLFASRVVREAGYCARKLQTCELDKPLIVQLCATGADDLAAAGKLVEPLCDAIDINLGCPLPQAASEGFGAWLLDVEHRPRLKAMVAQLKRAVTVPVFCKIRLLATMDESIALCRDLQAAGCSLIAVHGRTRPPLGQHRQHRDAPADLDAIRQLVASVDCPVLANGNTQHPSSVAANLELTGAAGVMAAEGLLRDPMLFSPGHVPSKDALASVALEYLHLAREFPPEMSMVRGHIMWMLGKHGKGHRCKWEHVGPFSAQQLHSAIVGAQSVDELETIVRCTLMS